MNTHQPRGIVCHQPEKIAAAALSSTPNAVRSAVARSGGVCAGGWVGGAGGRSNTAKHGRRLTIGAPEPLLAVDLRLYRFPLQHTSAVGHREAPEEAHGMQCPQCQAEAPPRPDPSPGWAWAACCAPAAGAVGRLRPTTPPFAALTALRCRDRAVH